MELLLMGATGAALCILLMGLEVLRRRGPPAEVTRRLAHVVGATVAATFPLYLQVQDILVLALLFAAFLTYTLIRGRMKSIHAVTRPSFGAPLFPVGLGIAALAALGHMRAFAFAALVLAFADTAAAIVGNWMTSPAWRVFGGRKSVTGSVAHFSATAMLATIFGGISGDLRPLDIVVVGAALTIVEGSFGYGLDNLLLPLTAALLGRSLLGL